jgi:hypothetical protein
MAFGQPSGPPATAKQVQQLLALLVAAGHSDFRDARGPMGFNQRQAAGKFTRDEADAFIEQLENEAQGRSSEPAAVDAPAIDTEPRPAPRAAAAIPAGPAGDRISAAQQTLRKFPAEMLAAELQRRGWVVMEP